MTQAMVNALASVLVAFVSTATVSAATPGPSPATSAANAGGVDVHALLDRVDDLFRGDESHGTMAMKVVTPHYTRDLELEQWSRGKDRFLVRILSPARERGTATLRIGPDIWNYLPAVDRVIKVPSSMMGGAWMGSDLTNDDLVKMSRMADDYEAHAGESTQDGKAAIELTLTPKPDAAVVWGKVVVQIDRATKLPLAILDYDESGTLARTTTFSDVKTFGGRQLPATMIVTPADRPGEYTRVEWKSLDFHPHLGDSFFSLENLKG